MLHVREGAVEDKTQCGGTRDGVLSRKQKGARGGTPCFVNLDWSLDWVLTLEEWNNGGLFPASNPVCLPWVNDQTRNLATSAWHLAQPSSHPPGTSTGFPANQKLRVVEGTDPGSLEARGASKAQVLLKNQLTLILQDRSTMSQLCGPFIKGQGTSQER